MNNTKTEETGTLIWYEDIKGGPVFMIVTEDKDKFTMYANHCFYGYFNNLKEAFKIIENYRQKLN